MSRDAVRTSGYARGWFVVAYAQELAPMAVTPLRYFGRDLVAWRGEDGRVRILDAFCPHLGAHLGRGGTVEGDDIACPFHAWRFDGTGTCTHIPYTDAIPRQATLSPWIVREQSGLVLVWFDPDGGAPDYEIPALEGYGTPGWSAWTPNLLHVATHPREIIENISDKAHFPTVHGTEIATFENEFTGHIAIQRASGVAYPRGGGADAFSLTATYFGPAYMITEMHGVLPSKMLVAHTPVDARSLDLRFGVILPTVASDEKMAGFIKAYADNLLIGFREDVAIWENKRFRERPRLCDGDGPLGRMRVWYRQFYAPRGGAAAAG